MIHFLTTNKRKSSFLIIGFCLIAVIIVSGCTAPEESKDTAKNADSTKESTTIAKSDMWPTDQQPVEKNPCIECKCPALLDDADYLTEEIFTDTRGFHYSEIIFTCPGEKFGGIYNATNYNLQADNSRESVPEVLMANYSDEKAMAEYGGASAWMEPARVWTPDKMRIFQSPTVRNFSGIDTRYSGGFDTAAAGGEGGAALQYTPSRVIRDSTWWYDAGKPIWIADAPNGMTFVMQSVTDQSGGYEGLDTLSDRLELPEGWTFRTVVLEEDLAINGLIGDDGTPNTWFIMQDTFHNSYSACWENAAGESNCNFIP